MKMRSPPPSLLETSLQFSRAVPMRCRATAVQQPASASTNAPVHVEAIAAIAANPAQKLDHAGVNAQPDAAATIRVSNSCRRTFVATPMPTELRIDPPVSDSR